MGKLALRPSVALFPLPVTLVTVGEYPGTSNIITLAWVCTFSAQPPLLTMSIGPRKHSVAMLKAGGEFVVNLATRQLMRQSDRCGMISGRDWDKWQESGLTPIQAQKVRPPLIAQCPVSMECVLRQVIPIGERELFVGEVVAMHADESVLDENGRIDPGRIDAIAYSQAQYWSQDQKLAVHGYSTKK